MESETKPRAPSSWRMCRVLLWTLGCVSLFSCVYIAIEVRSQWRVVRRLQCKSHLKGMILACHNYHDVYDSFPPAYTMNDDGERLHSWRTLILPFINHSELYEKIDLTKAWDDPANAKARKRVVSLYVCFEADLPEGMTIYHAVSGPETVFPSDGGSRSIDQILDGTDRTLMLVEVSRTQAVHWMSPHDEGLNFVELMSDQLESPHPGGTQCAYGDGQLGFLSNKLPAHGRRALTTIDDSVNFQ